MAANTTDQTGGRFLFFKTKFFPHGTIRFIFRFIALISKLFLFSRLDLFLWYALKFNPIPLMMKRLRIGQKVDFNSSKEASRFTECKQYSTIHTGYTNQESRTCSGQSAGFDLTGPVDFLSALSHTELWLTDLQVYRIFEHNPDMVRPTHY